MYSDSVIELSDFLPSVSTVEASSPSRHKKRRVGRRSVPLLAAVEAAVTVCIGLGFLVCLGLVFTML